MSNVTLTRIGNAYSDAKRVAVSELATFIAKCKQENPDVLRPLKIKYRRNKNGKEIVTGYKLSEPIYIEGDAEHSKMSEEEVEKYRKCCLIPALEAVEICTRGSDMYGTVAAALNGRPYKPKSSSQDVIDLLAITRVPQQFIATTPTILKGLPVVLDLLQDTDSEEKGLQYSDFLKKNKISVDKILHAMSVEWLAVSYEENEMLKVFGATTEDAPCLREQLLAHGDRFVDSAGKICGKSSLARKYLCYLTIITAFCERIYRHNTYLRD